tara:strand:+ start:652 stop:1116 length:465 start_codon:yes stop_codon:yes gene_type:complete
MRHKKQYYYLASLFFIFSCTNMSYQPDVVRKSDVQKQQYVVLGSILEITKVTIEGDREAGAVAGALIGGAAGQSITDSEPESDIASIVGGLVGSAAGAEIGSNLTKKEGLELLIKTDNGKLISIIQEVSKYDFKINQKVQIIKRNGKSRVLPFD